MYGKTEGFYFIGGKIMPNLLSETIRIMKENNKKPEDVKFIRCEWYDWGQHCEYEHYMTWEDFASQANREYDDGYGETEVKDDLQIVGTNWWLERHEYDGSEWWEFKKLPKRPKKYKKFSLFKYEED